METETQETGRGGGRTLYLPIKPVSCHYWSHTRNDELTVCEYHTAFRDPSGLCTQRGGRTRVKLNSHFGSTAFYLMKLYVIF